MKGLVPLMLALVAPLSSAQSLTVVYLEGAAELSVGSGWTNVSTGDEIPGDARIRVGTGSLIQIKGPGATLTVSRSGTYSVPVMLAEAKAISKAGTGPALERFMRILASGVSPDQSAVLGARGANEGSKEEEQWADSSAQVLVDAGKDYLNAGSYPEAAEQFKKALEMSRQDESAEIHYFLAYALFFKGDVVEAWKHLSALQPNSDDPWATEFMLLKARLLEETNSYPEAVSCLSENDLSQDALRAPLYYFLLGLAYRGAGDADNARRSLSKVLALSKESDLGKVASELLARFP